ncbi:hypothetical protein [Desulfatitalea alkaliphila]|uniref:Uncharacterized protein n=1 Tax=Desulfatitalea alkaliphila TaxID=2929485 RepID=A0AA41R687_9BACT|nr:hypothetical protein [Desulfatitalea alkaliphila]MCJ8501880.1 hypothetical protein [Desulfatitalea alkaliphila]
MSAKRYRIESSCPQCGCSFATHLTPEELKKKYGDLPNIELECGECMIKYTKPREEACPEWDKECRMKGQ